MKKNVLTADELNALEALEIRGGATRHPDSPDAQAKCTNGAAYCGWDVDQGQCLNSAMGCGVKPPSPEQKNCTSGPVILG